MSDEAKRLLVIMQVAARAANAREEWDMLDMLGLM